ncbi:MAG: segregation/condensation protein A [Phycisphaerae bacterium]
MSEPYRVQLDVFTGPLDLLLYLIRRDELDIQDIPIARVTEQYITYVKMLEELDPNTAGDFLVMAATLLEIKSRALLPTPPLEALDGEDEDPRSSLVRQLLEYKRFKDAARSLGSAADDRAKRYVRKPADLPPDLQGIDLEEAQVWDLLDAFNRVMTAIGQGPGGRVLQYEETPIELNAAEIVAILQQEGPTTFRDLFDGQHDRGTVVGRFLALLELVRSKRVRAEQDRNFGTIYLFLLEEEPELPPEEELAEPEFASPEATEMEASAPEAAGPSLAAAEMDSVPGEDDEPVSDFPESPPDGGMEPADEQAE